MKAFVLRITVGALFCSVFSWGQVLDALIADSGNQPVTLYKNNGTAFFEETPVELDTTGSNEARALLLADFDNDGDPDLMIGYQFANHVWFNDGFGNFSDSGQSLGEVNTVALKAGDFDGDGDLDVFAGNWSNPNTIWLNNGSGVFTESPQVFSITEPAEGEEQVADAEDTNAVDVGDLDGDGDLDIFFANLNSDGKTQTWFNDGSGNFTLGTERLALGTFDIFDLALGDLDSDGDLDVFFANLNDSPDLVYLNNGSGSFSTTGELLGKTRSVKVVLGDLDLDGDLDALIANSDFHCDGANHVWINNGDGTFEEGVYFGNDPSMDASLADFDGDGDLDAIIANRGTSGWANRVWINDGAANFFDSGQRLGNDQTIAVVSGNIRSSEAKAKSRLIIVPQIDGTEALTLVLENPTSTPQSMKIEGFSNKGDLLQSIALAFGPLERKTVSIDQFPGCRTLALTDRNPVTSYLASGGSGLVNEVSQFRNSWKFISQTSLQTSLYISNPQAVEAEVLISFGNSKKPETITIPALGSISFQYPKNGMDFSETFHGTLSKGPVSENFSFQIESQIPVATLCVQRLREYPELILVKQPLP